MLGVLFTVILVSLVLAYSYFYYKTKRALKWYKETLEGLGYKVLEYPFVFIGSGVISHFKQDGAKYGDEYYTLKRLDQSYDMALFNVLSNVVI